MRKLAIMLLMSFVLLGSLGCRSGNQIITPSSDITSYNATSEQVKKIIIQECAILGWNAKDKDANTIVASILVRNKHYVVVEIPYTATTYSIKYVSSKNMEATVDGKIHPNYNSWVSNLNNAINGKLAFNKM